MSRPPDLVGTDNRTRAWKFVAEPDTGPADWKAGIASWLIEAEPHVLDPYGFTSWFVGVVSLRDVPGVQPANRHYPEAEYEMQCFTIDPEKGVTIDTFEARIKGDFSGPKSFLVTPPDIVFQWHGTTDEQALGVAEAFVEAVVMGEMPPSRPAVPDGDVVARLVASRFDSYWRRRLQATVDHFAVGHIHLPPDAHVH